MCVNSVCVCARACAYNCEYDFYASNECLTVVCVFVCYKEKRKSHIFFLSAAIHVFPCSVCVCDKEKERWSYLCFLSAVIHVFRVCACVCVWERGRERRYREGPKSFSKFVWNCMLCYALFIMFVCVCEHAYLCVRMCVFLCLCLCMCICVCLCELCSLRNKLTQLLPLLLFLLQELCVCVCVRARTCMRECACTTMAMYVWVCAYTREEI